MASLDVYLCPMCGTSIAEATLECPACGETLPLDASHSPSESSSVSDFARAKRKRLIWMLVLSIAAGVAEVLLPDAERAIQIADSFAIVLLIASWCQLDAHQRNETLGRLLRLTIIFFTFVGLPVYLFRTRGIRGFLSLFLALLFYVLLIALQLGSMALTEYVV
jgi:hypothetical protein